MAKLVIVCKFCKRYMNGEEGETGRALLIRFLDGSHNYKPYHQGNKEISSRYCIVLLEDHDGVAKCIEIKPK